MTSLSSSQRFGQAYLRHNQDESENEADSQGLEGEDLEDFMGSMVGIDDDAISDSRSAIDLDPFKKDLGNRFSVKRPEDRESFLQANPLALSRSKMMVPLIDE